MLQHLEQDPTWMLTLVTALVAALGAVAVHVAGRAVLRRMTRHSIVLTAMLRDTERAGALLLPLLAMQVVWGAAPDDMAYIRVVRHVNGLLLLAAATWFAIRAISGLAEGVISRHPIYIEDNLQARRIATQTRVLARSGMVVILIAGIAMALMTFPGARQLGASLLASAGVLGIIGGLAAKPVFSNLIAGLQLALAQPIRLDDVLIVNGEWGKVEEITGTYVVLKIWDERRLIVPLTWFIENPFQNWTRTGSEIIGTLFMYVDYLCPVEPIRAEAQRLAEAAAEWDRRVFNLQVTDVTDRAVQLRVIVSSRDAGRNFDLRCKLREGLLAFLAREYPQNLPQFRIPALPAPP
ncbi:MAG TPA: mechanosensitive ion channel domain-containing protein [Ramlibacter sp.]|uniref:mechanosensitive ion channel family protein n=1 Tax=Ramlibacter sp. TaxID=1917967 RepID=UPI002ED3BC71